MSPAARPNINFDEPIGPQIPRSLGPKESLALSIRAFVSSKSGNTLSFSDLPRLSAQLEFLVSFCRENIGKVSDVEVLLEFDRIKLYRELIQLLASRETKVESSSALALFRSTGRGRVLEHIFNYTQLDQFVQSASTVSEFRVWVSKLGMVGSQTIQIPITSFLRNSVPGTILSYKDFSADPRAAVFFILDTLLAPPGETLLDPFLPREVEKLLQSASRCFNILDIDILVFDWFMSSIDVGRDILNSQTDSALFLYMNGFHRIPDSIPISSNFTKNIAYFSILKKRENFEEFLAFIPAMLAIPGLVPEDLSDDSWIPHLALLTSKSEDIEIFNSTVSLLTSPPSSVGLESHHGQFGISLLSPVAGLIESDTISFPISDTQLTKFQISYVFGSLFLVEKKELGIEILQTRFTALADSEMKARIAWLILERVFHPLICSYREGEDVSMIESAILVIDGLGDDSKELNEYRQYVCVMEFFKKTDNRDFTTKLRIDQKLVSEYFRTPKRIIDPTLLEDVIVREIIASGKGSELAKLIGIQSTVNARVLRDLLVNCWDSDIDPFLEGLDGTIVTSIFLEIVESRLAVVVQRLCEDTGRLHGIMIALVASNSELKKLLSLEIKNEELEQCVTEWLCEDEQSVRSILESCRRLLYHPCVDAKKISALLTCISDINSSFS